MEWHGLPVCEDQDPCSPAPSCDSMESYRSMDSPPYFDGMNSRISDARWGEIGQTFYETEDMPPSPRSKAHKEVVGGRKTDLGSISEVRSLIRPSPDSGSDAVGTEHSPDSGSDAVGTEHSPDSGGDAVGTEHSPDSGGDAVGTEHSPDSGGDAVGTEHSPDSGGDAVGTEHSPDSGSDAVGTEHSPDSGSDAVGTEHSTKCKARRRKAERDDGENPENVKILVKKIKISTRAML